MSHIQLSTKELLARVIGKRAAQRMYTGYLHPLFVPEGEVDPAQAILLDARELVHRWFRERLQIAPIFDSPQHMREYLHVHFSEYDREVFVALFLDNRHRLLAVEDLFFGTIDMAHVHPREVVKRALMLNAAALIVAHNHPSGVAEPSPADELVTQRLREALALVDIRLIDHVVIGAGTATSFAERGLL